MHTIPQMHMPKEQVTQIRKTVEYAKKQGWVRQPTKIQAPPVLQQHIQEARVRLIKANNDNRDLIVRLKPSGRRLSLGTKDMEEAVLRGAQLMAISDLHGEEQAVLFQQQEFRKINQFV